MEESRTELGRVVGEIVHVDQLNIEVKIMTSGYLRIPISLVQGYPQVGACGFLLKRDNPSGYRFQCETTEQTYKRIAKEIFNKYGACRKFLWKKSGLFRSFLFGIEQGLLESKGVTLLWWLLCLEVDELIRMNTPPSENDNV